MTKQLLPGEREASGDVNEKETGTDKALELQRFCTWLPQELRSAPGISWDRLSSRLMGYCLKTIGTSPDKGCVALAIGTAIGSLDQYSLFQYTGWLYRLLRSMRRICDLQHHTELSNKSIWEAFALNTEMSQHRRQELTAYVALVDKYERDYLDNLEPDQRARLGPYVLPSMPPRVFKKYSGARSLTAQSRQRRREKSDVLAPLYHVLVAIVQMRKQAAERLVNAFRMARERALDGEALPVRFSYEDINPSVNQEATTINEIQLGGKQVTLNFVLWDYPSWIQAHPDRFSPKTRRVAERNKTISSPGNRSRFFLQFDGPADDLLWIGNIIAQRLVCALHEGKSTDSQIRRSAANAYGVSKGFYSSRSGLLAPGWHQLAHLHLEPSELIFEPESLYRGVLMGATLATIALTNGSRVNELLQVSLDRRKVRTEVATMTKDGRSEQRRTTIHLQHLLPKGAKTEEERQYFLLSPQSVALLGEICQILIAEYGEVPVVAPYRHGAKVEHLKPERYLFQWAASPDGRLGSLGEQDVLTLLRFLLHGLEVSTSEGEPRKTTMFCLAGT